MIVTATVLIQGTRYLITEESQPDGSRFRVESLDEDYNAAQLKVLRVFARTEEFRIKGRFKDRYIPHYPLAFAYELIDRLGGEILDFTKAEGMPFDGTVM